MKLKKYNKDLVFKHRPDWAYWPEISKSIVGYEKALIRFTNPLPDNDKDFEKLKASVVVTHSSSGNDKDSSTSTDILSEIPDKIKKVFKKAVKAGYMQKQDNGIYHWNKPYTKKLLAYFGYCFYSYDLETYHWKLMEKVFGSQANYLATYFSKHYYKNYTPQTSEEKEIDKWFNS